MNVLKSNKSLHLLLGITLFTQAVTSLIGGILFLSPFSPKEMTPEFMFTIQNDTTAIYSSITLQMITSIVIIILAVVMYQLGKSVNKTLGIIALSFYALEATMLFIGQFFVWGLLKTSQLYSISYNPSLLDIGNILVSCKEFIGSMAMIPFGLGAILFYYLMMKAKIFPKWLGIWALVSVTFILIGIPLKTFGLNIPFILFVPYVPFEFFAGIYSIIIAIRKKPSPDDF